MRRHLGKLLFTVATLVAAAAIHLYSSRIIARDALYHLAHAGQYAEQGPLMSQFPWLPYSVINSYAADIWYGFHLLLAPITLIGDQVTALDIAGVVTLGALLILFGLALQRLKLSLPFFWPFVLLVPFAWRFAQVRPNTLSVGLGVLLLALVLDGSIWGALLVSTALTFLHLAFFWLAIGIATAVTLLRLLVQRQWSWKPLAASLAGVVLGWLLRPHPLGAAKILNVQLFLLMQEKGHGRLAFGRELSPMGLGGVRDEYGPFLYLWLGAVALFLVAMAWRKLQMPGSLQILLWTSLGLSALFFVMTTSMSARVIDLWAPFAVLFIAGAFHVLIDPRQPAIWPGPRFRWLVTIMVAALLVTTTWFSVPAYDRKIRRGVPPDRLQAAAVWLDENTQPGEVIFHVNWGIFPELFYWNQSNRYIGGMDPIFQYAFDRQRYWKTHHLWSGTAIRQTWGSEYRQTPPEETYTVLRRDFGATHVLLDSVRSAALLNYIRGDRRFQERFNDGRIFIFELQGGG